MPLACVRAKGRAPMRACMRACMLACLRACAALARLVGGEVFCELAEQLLQQRSRIPLLWAHRPLHRLNKAERTKSALRARSFLGGGQGTSLRLRSKSPRSRADE
eukprot:6196685-Pleurochrysis_carterae.AAC.1